MCPFTHKPATILNHKLVAYLQNARKRVSFYDTGIILFGGPGKDTIDAHAGNDTIYARDKTRDIVRCGPGRDTVTADKTDKLTNCEKVSRR